VNRKGPWYESDNPDRVARAGYLRIVVYVVLTLAIIGMLSGVGWAFKVALSPAKGAGDQARRNNSADNRIYAQGHFLDLYGDIEAYGVQLKQAAADKTANPGDSYYTTVYTGIFTTCVSAVTQYNADVNKALFSDWRSTGLPEHIDAADACGAPDSPSTTPSK
jgi:hypothetical protein